MKTYAEGFRPISHTPPDSALGKVKFYARMLLDLQILTIYRDLKALLPSFRGRVLDVGCGQSPYKFLLNSEHTEYSGIDIFEADSFDYYNRDITPFNGIDIPFDDDTFDALICTEVLEHVPHYQALIDEMHRVLKKGGIGIVTVPWSARYHYIPYDFFRYTPSSLKTMFSKFDNIAISHRGTDITSIGNKLIVLWFRNLFPSKPNRWLLTPLWLIASPILLAAVVIAHVCLLLDAGSQDDPLGYTLIVKK